MSYFFQADSLVIFAFSTTDSVKGVLRGSTQVVMSCESLKILKFENLKSMQLHSQKAHFSWTFCLYECYNCGASSGLQMLFCLMYFI